MMFGKPSGEDLRKIHSEINQLANQRFLLTTLAISVFTLLLAWQLRGQNNHPDLLVYTSYAIQTLLAVLYFVNFHLLRKCRMLTTYLLASASSPFERDWAAYRERFKYFGYTTAQSLVYGFLLLATGLSPIVFHSVSAADSETEASILFIVSPLLLAFSLILVMLAIHRQHFEDRAKANWDELKLGAEPSSEDGSSAT